MGTRVAATALVVLLFGGIPTGASAAAGDIPATESTDGDMPDGGVCSSVPGVAGGLCDGVIDVLGGGIGAIVGGGTDAVLDSMVAFVVDGAGWLLNQLTGVIDTSTRPDLQSDWFQAAYGDMAVIGGLGILPFLLLAMVQALMRQDAGLMLRATFGYVPLAAIGTAGAVVVVDLLVQLTDALSVWVGRGLGADLSNFSTGLGSALAKMSVPTGGAVAGLAALIGAAVIAFASFVIWLELLLRQAAIYVAVLFFPLAFMAMVWPATAHWVRRLVQGLVAVDSCSSWSVGGSVPLVRDGETVATFRGWVGPQEAGSAGACENRDELVGNIVGQGLSGCNGQYSFGPEHGT